MIPLTEIFCYIDDFCKFFERKIAENALTSSQKKKRGKPCSMALSEIMTIVIMFHLSHYKTFKDFYLNSVCENYRSAFPSLVSYNRFIELMPNAFMPLLVMIACMRGKKTSRYFIDSTKLPVCHNLRISHHKVFDGIASRGKTSTGWFFGLKLHLVINEYGEIVNFTLTPGNIDDRKVVEQLAKDLKGCLFGDRGYISKNLKNKLKEKGLELITKVKKNMKEQFLDPIQKFFLSKRNVIETVIDQIKNLCTVDHTRHRSPMNAQVNILSGVVAYIFKPKKPSVGFATLNHISEKSMVSM
jgi:hypothetical protein